jgi:beta-glucanase (GH16 family)
VFLLIAFPVHAQGLLIMDDFEGNGTIDSWYEDDCSMIISLDNPFKDSVNPSNKVLRYHDFGGQYANIGFNVSNNFDLTDHHSFMLKIYIPSDSLTGLQTNKVSVKLQNGFLGAPWSTQSEVIKPINLDEWQIVHFNFKTDDFINFDPNSAPPIERTDFNRVLIQVNGENNNDQVVAFIDDFSYDGAISSDPIYDQLVWSDEFENNGPIDSEKWFHQTILPNGQSWYNGEIQHYTDRIDNSEVKDGILKITAKKESFTDQGQSKNYTSARLNSKFAFTYGLIEVRAKLPKGIGTWPAIWMLGKNINENGAYWQTQGYGTTPWPACGEIDIMEHWGHNQDYVSSATHTPSSYGGTINVGGQYLEGVSDTFHIYKLLWTPEKLVFSVDDKVHFSYNPAIKDDATWPFDKDQYIIFNVAILSDIESTDFTESSLDIDYIRVYQEGNVSSNQNLTEQDYNVYPNPFDYELFIQLEDPRSLAKTINIYSLQGELILKREPTILDNGIVINDLEILQKGIYIVQLKLGQELHHVQVFKL